MVRRTEVDGVRAIPDRPALRGPLDLTVGDLVGGQHRLHRLVHHGARSLLWQAVDENLARPVAVALVPGDERETAPLLTAAARAGRVNNPRVARIYDAGHEHAYAYVVREWVDGTALDTLLADGPLPADQATDLAAAVALAVAGAHDQGCPHGRLRPGGVLLTREGRVVLVDLATAAAVDGPAPGGDPVAADATAIGGLYYALLTGAWPLSPPTILPPAPTHDGWLCTPRQARGGVPREADNIVRRLLAPHLTAHPAPIDSPRAAARALTERPAPSVPLPVEPAPPRRRGARLLRLVLVLLLLAAAGVIGWLAGLDVGALPPTSQDYGLARLPTASPQPDGGEPARAGTVPIPVVAVRDFDPQGDGREDSRDLGAVTDGDPDTTWATDTYYGSPAFGGLKSGVGLLLDLGAPATVSSVQVGFAAAGTSVELRVADTAGATADSYRVVANAEAGTSVSLTPAAPVAARYLLVWFTRLPEGSGGYRTTVKGITVTGSTGAPIAPAEGAPPAASPPADPGTPAGAAPLPSP